MVFITVLLAIYLGGSTYFTKHFYLGSQINGINIGGLTVNEAKDLLSSEIPKYKLELKLRDGKKEEINGDSIDLTYDPKDKIENLKENQNAFYWPKSIFSKSNSTLNDIVTFNQELLDKQINSLSCINENIINPKNPSFKYTSNGYQIIPEEKGNKIKKEVLYEAVKNAIINGETKINLEQMNCYDNPKFNVDSKEVNKAKDLLDKYTNLRITYDFEDSKEILDGSTIKNWLYVNDDMEVMINEKNVSQYVYSLASKYNTFSKSREFHTSLGETVTVTGGNYGWIVDKPAETKSLIEIIKKGKSVTKKPAYSQTAVSRSENDIGNTYLEVNFAKQHIWYYKDGQLIADGDVVTGNVSNNFGTPVGTYRLTYTEKNATLKGENYSAPVNYWMPFNGNIGLHDATWRTEFGGQIYLTSGSHGCINAPYELAEKIFQNIKAGTPVVCY
ncbi:L,D-transpeptidase family protein [Clostridium taeniosporum]|uniref:Peptidoglycan-binding protein n=1 Tax=Clostridium taeniosporum TaxID=394958 RepID=A0A1D7XJC4_9CLOT|nr:L,D-transpeptidase family protein [Clostridium taeniosporum]AOR23433.2 peptidoglycan-binding protein [Clostridium taeniosporum]